MSAFGGKADKVQAWRDVCFSSLIGHLGSSAFRLSTTPVSMSAHGLSLLFGLGTKALPSWGFEDEVEQSFGRPRRQCDGRSKRTKDLTSSSSREGHHSTAGWSSISSYRI